MFTMPFGFFSGALTSGGLSLFERPVTDAVLQSGSSDTTSTFGSLSGAAEWYGGVLAPNGNIYGIPFDATTVLKLTTGNYSQVDPLLLSAYQNKF